MRCHHTDKKLMQAFSDNADRIGKYSKSISCMFALFNHLHIWKITAQSLLFTSPANTKMQNFGNFYPALGRSSIEDDQSVRLTNEKVLQSGRVTNEKALKWPSDKTKKFSQYCPVGWLTNEKALKWPSDKRKSCPKWSSGKPALRDFWHQNKWSHLPRSQLQRVPLK